MQCTLTPLRQEHTTPYCKRSIEKMTDLQIYEAPEITVIALDNNDILTYSSNTPELDVDW